MHIQAKIKSIEMQKRRWVCKLLAIKALFKFIGSSWERVTGLACDTWIPGVLLSWNCFYLVSLYVCVCVHMCVHVTETPSESWFWICLRTDFVNTIAAPPCMMQLQTLQVCWLVDIKTKVQFNDGCGLFYFGLSALMLPSHQHSVLAKNDKPEKIV